MVTLNYTTRRVMASSGGPPGQMQAINISDTSARTSARARAPTTSPTGTSSRGPGWAAASTGPATRPSPTATCWTAAGSAGGGTASSSSPSPTARGTRACTAGAPGRGAGPRLTPCPTTQSSLQIGILSKTNITIPSVKDVFYDKCFLAKKIFLKTRYLNIYHMLLF